MIAIAPSSRLLAVFVSTLLILSACAGPGQTPGPVETPGEETPAGTPPGEEETPEETAEATPGEETPEETAEGTPGEETPEATAEGTPGEETPEATAGAAASPPTGATGDLFAFGVTYEQADEIGQVRQDFFRELNPDVNLTVSESSFDEAAFLTALQTAQPPDVVVMDTSLLGTYVARDVLAPMDDCFAQHGIDTSKFYEAPLTQATINGQIYGAPEFMTTMNWLINESAFTDAGLDPAAFDFADWDAIRQANEATLQADGQITALGIDPKVPEFLPLWAKANGADLLSEDGTTAQLDRPEVVEALQLAVDLINAHGGPSPFLDFRGTWDFFGAANQFATDQVAAHPMEQWYLNVLAGASADADVLARPFVDRQGNGLTFATGSSIAITTAAQNPEAACIFALALTHEEAWVRAAQERVELREASGEPNTGVFTANTIANDRIFSEVVPPEEIPAPWGENVQVYLDNWANAFALPASPANAAIFFGNESILAQAVARALEGEDPQTVLTEANEQAQEAIDQAGQ